jgi:hypothetical protein
MKEANMDGMKKCGGWSGSYGGRDFGGSKGKVNMLGQSKGKGVPSSSKPAVQEGKQGQVNFLGKGGNKGIPSKGGSGGGLSSQQAAILGG